MINTIHIIRYIILFFIILNSVYIIIAKLNIFSIKKYIKTILFKYNIFVNINKKIEYIKYSLNYHNKILSLTSFILASFILGISMFIFFMIQFKILISSIISFILGFLIPSIILDVVIMLVKNSIRNDMSFYIINLENFSRNTNDVILALSKVRAGKFLNVYLKEFNMLILNGFNVSKAFDNFSNSINIKEISTLIYMLKLCYINGGDLNNVLNKFNKYYFDINRIKTKQREKNISALLLLLIILIVNILLLFVFCMNNIDYRNIILNTFIGKILFILNSLIYLSILVYIKKLIKKEW